jgi:hypothetical protein
MVSTCIDDSVLQNTDIFVHYKTILCNTCRRAKAFRFGGRRDLGPRMIAKDVMGVMRGLALSSGL